MNITAFLSARSPSGIFELEGGLGAESLTLEVM